MTESFDIAVTGRAAVSAAGVGTDPLDGAVRSGQSFLRPADGIPGGPLQGKADAFRPGDFMPPLKARKFDRCSLFAVAAAGMAARESGIACYPPERIGITLGSGFGGIDNSSGFLTGYFRSGVEGLAPMLFPNTVPNAPASNASIELGFKGTNVTFVQRFCSAESALLMALRGLTENRADAFLSGGADDLTPLMLQAFGRMKQFRRHARWFGEGAGIVALERREDAESRGALIHGLVTGVRTVGSLLPEHLQEGVERLLPPGRPGLVVLSGTAADLPFLRDHAAGAGRVLDLGPLVGRSLAMGGISLVALLGLLQPGEKGLLLSASPEGPFYSIEVCGAPVS